MAIASSSLTTGPRRRFQPTAWRSKSPFSTETPKRSQPTREWWDVYIKFMWQTLLTNFFQSDFLGWDLNTGKREATCTHGILQLINSLWCNDSTFEVSCCFLLHPAGLKCEHHLPALLGFQHRYAPCGILKLSKLLVIIFHTIFVAKGKSVLVKDSRNLKS